MNEMKVPCKLCDGYYDLFTEVSTFNDGMKVPRYICYKCFAAISWQIIDTAMNIKKQGE